MRRFAANQLSSFPGEANGLSSVNDMFDKVDSIKRFATPRSYDTMLFVGPFATVEAAVVALPKLCEVLNENGDIESSCDEIVTKRDGSNFYTRGSFDLSGVRVVPHIN